MAPFVGLDVSLKFTSIDVVKADGSRAARRSICGLPSDRPHGRLGDLGCCHRYGRKRTRPGCCLRPRR